MISYDCIIQSRHAWIRRYHVGGDEAQHVGVAQHEMQQNQTYDANAYTRKDCRRLYLTHGSCSRYGVFFSLLLTLS